MAKKEKIELTPEELEAKKARKKEKRGIFGKTFTRVFGWLLAVVLVYSVAHIAFGPRAAVATSGGNTSTEQTTKAPSQDNWDIGDSSSGSDSTSTDDKQDEGTKGDGKGDAASTGLSVNSKDEAAELLNKATAAAANGKAGYTYSKVTDYTGDGMKLDSKLMQSGANAILGNLKTPTSVEKVVGDFIGIGETNGTFTKGSAAGKNAEGDALKDIEALKASTIKGSDVTDYKISGNKIQITLADCTDPLRDEGCSLARLTNDFLNKGDVVEALAAQNDVPATLNDGESTVSYNTIVITAMIENDKLTALKYSFVCNARVGISLGLTVKGTGTAERVLTYSNFKY